VPEVEHLRVLDAVDPADGTVLEELLDGARGDVVASIVGSRGGNARVAPLRREDLPALLRVHAKGLLADAGDPAVERRHHVAAVGGVDRRDQEQVRPGLPAHRVEVRVARRLEAQGLVESPHLAVVDVHDGADAMRVPIIGQQRADERPDAHAGPDQRDVFHVESPFQSRCSRRACPTLRRARRARPTER